MGYLISFAYTEMYAVLFIFSVLGRLYRVRLYSSPAVVFPSVPVMAVLAVGALAVGALRTFIVGAFGTLVAVLVLTVIGCRFFCVLR